MHVDLCKENIKEGNITKSTSFFSAKQKDLLFVAPKAFPFFFNLGPQYLTLLGASWCQRVRPPPPQGGQ